MTRVLMRISPYSRPASVCTPRGATLGPLLTAPRGLVTMRGESSVPFEALAPAAAPGHIPGVSVSGVVRAVVRHVEKPASANQASGATPETH